MTTIALLGLSVYMGVAFKDIAVIKMIKGQVAASLRCCYWLLAAATNGRREKPGNCSDCVSNFGRCHPWCLHHVALLHLED